MDVHVSQACELPCVSAMTLQAMAHARTRGAASRGGGRIRGAAHLSAPISALVAHTATLSRTSAHLCVCVCVTSCLHTQSRDSSFSCAMLACSVVIRRADINGVACWRTGVTRE